MTLEIEGTQQLQATASYSDGTTADVTADATWTSTAPAVAGVDAAGLVTALAAGDASVTASFEGKEGSTAVTVAAASLEEIQVTPTGPSIAAGFSQQFTATGIYSDSSTADLSGQVTWSSSSASVASISNSGLASGLASGQTTISASHSGVSGSTQLTVTAAELESIEVTPAAHSLAAGTEQQYTATGVYSDNSNQDLTDQVSWSSSNETVATIGNSSGQEGLLNALTTGSTTISASFSSINGSTQLTVTAAALSSIQVTPTEPSIAAGTDQQFVATGIYTDGSDQDISSGVDWSSSAPAVATVNSAGLASSLTQGSATISASSGDISGSTSLIVTAAVMERLEISPPAPSIALGTTAQFSATAIFSDDSTQDVTASVTWTSSVGSVAQVNNANHKGLATSLTRGETTITASDGTFTDSTTLTVSQAVLHTLAVQAVETSVPKGLKVQFEAIGTFTDHHTQNMTPLVTWSSDNNNIAAVSNAAGERGVVTATGVGTTDIIASLGAMHGALEISVTDAELVGIEVTPGDPDNRVPLGLPQHFVATGHFTDSSQRPLTADVTWSSSNEQVATVSNASGEKGLAVTLASGDTVVMARLDDVAGETLFTVSEAELEDLLLEPATPTIPLGGELRLHLIGIFTDGSEQDLSEMAAWDSAAEARIFVYNTAGNKGLCTALSEGPGTIVTASYQGQDVTTMVTAGSAVIERLQIVVPGQAPPVAPVGLSQQLDALAHFTDGHFEPRTGMVEWRSDDPAIAQVNNNQPNKGAVMAVAEGAVLIHAVLTLPPDLEFTASIEFIAEPPVVESVRVAPLALTMRAGHREQLTAIGMFSDGVTRTVTHSVHWFSQTPMIAEVADEPGQKGMVVARQQGETDIVAALPGLPVAQSHITVQPAVVEEIEIQPIDQTVIAGAVIEFMAMGLYSDGRMEPVTHMALWTSSLPEVATIGNGGAGNPPKGHLLAVAAGTTEITAVVGPPQDQVSATTTLTVTDATLQMVEIRPGNPHIVAGFDLPFEAWGHYSDHRLIELTEQVTWDSLTPSVATISNDAGSQGLATAVAAGETTITATIDDGTGPVVGDMLFVVTEAILEMVEVLPPNESVPAGGSLQYQAWGHYSDGTSRDISGDVIWHSTNNGIATIDAAGAATAVAAGVVSISATLGPKSGATVLNVTTADLEYIEVTPVNPEVAAGMDLRFRAFGLYSDNSNREITLQVTWRSSDTDIVTITNQAGEIGFASARAAGSATITATLDLAQGSSDVTVSSATLDRIDVMPVDARVPEGTQLQLTAWGNYSDGTITDITDQVVWSSADEAIAWISNDSGAQGMVTGMAEGPAVMTASLDGTEGTRTVVVTLATLDALEITPEAGSIASGTHLEFVATGLFSNGEAMDMTGDVLWTSSDPLVAVVGNTVSTKGIARGEGEGNTTITARFGTGGEAVEATASLEVTSEELEFLELTPLNPELPAGTELPFVAMGHFSDHSVQNVTDQVTWSSSNTSVVSISNSEEEAGLATTLSAGNSTISATYEHATAGTIVAGTPFAVTDALLLSIEVTPQGGELAAGTEQQFTAFGHYSDGSSEEVTDQVNWSSSAPAIAVASNAEGDVGLVTAVAMGQATISAYFQGKTGHSVLVVSNATLESVEVAPLDGSIANGTHIHFFAIGHYTNHTTQNLTDRVVWSSAATEVASISNAQGEAGRATGNSQGSATITASFAVDESTTVEGSAELEVTAETLQFIEVTPQFDHIAAGTQLQFAAHGHYSDNSTQEITADVTWTTSSSAIAEISNAEGDQGLLSAVDEGSVTVTATLGEQDSGSTLLHVRSPDLTAVEVSPQGETIAKGTRMQLFAYGIFTDGTAQDLTGMVSWSAATSSIAHVSNAVGQKGLALGNGEGSTTVTATFNGVSGDAELNVTAETLEFVEVVPHFPKIAAGHVIGFRAIGHYSDGSHQDITEDVSWSVDNETYATISNADGEQGQAQGVAEGSAVVSATIMAEDAQGQEQELVGSTDLEVTAALLNFIELTPGYPEIAKGTTVQMEAWGHYSDGTALELTGEVTWSTGNSSTAVVSNGTSDKGLVTGVAMGTTSVSADFGETASGATTVTVTLATLQQIEIHPYEPHVALGTRMQLHAVGLFSDDTVREITRQVTWSSSDASTATVSNAEEEIGLANTVAEGGVTVTAMHMADDGSTVSGTASLTVTAGVLDWVEVTPHYPEIPNGVQLQFAAIGHYTDGTNQDLTDQVTWTSSNANTAVISNMQGENGLAMAAAQGTTVVTATIGETFYGFTTLTVRGAILQSLQLHPHQPLLANGTRRQLHAAGVFTDGTVRDMTPHVTWTVDDETYAVISNADGERGVITGLAEGTVTATASWVRISDQTTITGTVDVEVTAGVMSWLELTPGYPDIPNGVQLQFTAIGHYTDGSSQELTDMVSWASSDSAVAVVSNAEDKKGLANALAQGTTTVSARFGETFVASTTLRVRQAVLQQIEILPPDPHLANGTRMFLHAMGHFSDGAVRDITPQVTFVSSDESYAVVSNADGEHGLVTSVAEGSVTISASKVRTADEVTITGTVALEVTAAALLFVEVTPHVPAIPDGMQLQFAATGHYTDGTSLDLTEQVAWSSSDSNVAVVSNAEAEQGLASASGVGVATISARFDETFVGSTALTVKLATLQAIEVHPYSPEVPVGMRLRLMAIGHFSDGAVRNITGDVTWSSEDETVAVVSNAMGEKGQLVAVADSSTAVTITASRIRIADGQEIQGTTEVTVTSAVLNAIEVTPVEPHIAAGTSLQFAAVGHYSDGSSQEITEQVSWASDDATVAVASNADDQKGLGSALSQGTAQISATLDGTSGYVTLTVTPALLDSLEVVPMETEIAKGTRLVFRAFGYFSDGTSRELTPFVTWSSDDTTVAAISNGWQEWGLTHGIEQGSVTITASIFRMSDDAEVTGQAALTVLDAALQSILVTPVSPTIADGTFAPFHATGHYSDGTVQDLTDQVAWSCSDQTVAVISNQSESYGVVEAVDMGQATITAAFGDITGTAALTVEQALLTSLEVAPYQPAIALGTGIQFHAIGHFSNGTWADMTRHVTWSSALPSIAVVSNAEESRGWASSFSNGETTVTATFGETTGSVTLHVTEALLTSLMITPQGKSIAAGTSIPLFAFGLFTDGTHQDLTHRVAWASSDPTVAMVSNADPHQGLAYGIAQSGTAVTISATYDGTTATAELEVNAALLQAIEVVPQHPSLAEGLEIEMRALGLFSDGAIIDITDNVLWSSVSSSTAIVSNADGEKGRATALQMGSTAITATHGAVSGATTMQVTQASLEFVEVVPHHPSMGAGTKYQAFAFAHFSDGSRRDVTPYASWGSSDAAVAMVSNQPGRHGQVVTLAQGDAVISAVFEDTTGSTQVHVTAATIDFIEVTPARASIAVGTDIHFMALAHFTDYHIQDITPFVTWTSNDVSVAQVSNAPHSHGWVHGVEAGTAEIKAFFDDNEGTAQLAVNDVTLQSITLLPADDTMVTGSTIKMWAEGSFSDGTTQDVTHYAVWGSSDLNAVAVSNDDRDRGAAHGVAAGSATVTASYRGVSGTTLLTVVDATLESITVTSIGGDSGSVTIPGGMRLFFKATGNFSGGVTMDLTDVVNWRSSDETAVVVANRLDHHGLAYALVVTQESTATVTAYFAGSSGSINVTVSTATLESLALTSPSGESLTVAGHMQFTATGTFSDSSTMDLTKHVAWRSSDSAVAIVDNHMRFKGLATGVSASSVTISAYRGQVSQSMIILVE